MPSGRAPRKHRCRVAGRLDGKVALITGGARGQGAAEAELFAAEGASVVITDVRDEEGAATAASIDGAIGSVHYLHQDVTDETRWGDIVADIVEAHGGLDVLINNAGIFVPKPMLETTQEEYRRTIDINQVGTYLGMRAAAPAMRDSGGGSIVNISSIAGMLAAPDAFAYGASKWAVRGMTKAAAHELGKHNIRVNSIHPGIIDTAMLHEARGQGAAEAKVFQIPLGRAGEAMDIARLALFLASDDASYISAGEYLIDGAFMS